MRSIGVLLVFAACHSGGAAAPDATPMFDAAPPQQLGLVVAWSAKPSLPGALSDTLVVSDARFQISSLELIGDAGPGDERTTHSKYLLTWDSAGGPTHDTFPDAPVGMYSKITVNMSSGTLGAWSYQFHGTWRDAGVTKPFKIEDRVSLRATLDCQQMLAAAGSTTIPISVELDDAISKIDFRHLPQDDNGVLTLTTGTSGMLEFRDRLSKGFQIPDDAKNN